MAQQKTAQEYLIKAKLYRFMSLVFLAFGIFVFCALYVKNVEGKLLDALKNPMTIAIFLVPFFPAVVLSFLADGAEKKFKKMTEGNAQKK
jgi:hypothetical protein